MTDFLRIRSTECREGTETPLQLEDLIFKMTKFHSQLILALPST